MSSISANECGTEWWCPVVAKEHCLRWGLLLVVAAWVMLAEWVRYEKIRPLIRLFQSKLAWCEGFEFDTDKTVVLGVSIAVGVASQFASSDGVPVSPGHKWALALIFGIGVMILFANLEEFGSLGAFKFRSSDSINTRYRVFCRSAQGPFLLIKFTIIDGDATKELTTVDELVAFVAKPKSN